VRGEATTHVPRLKHADSRKPGVQLAGAGVVVACFALALASGRCTQKRSHDRCSRSALRDLPMSLPRAPPLRWRRRLALPNSSFGDERKSRGKKPRGRGERGGAERRDADGKGNTNHKKKETQDMNVVIKCHTAHQTICDYFLGCLLWYKGTSVLPKRHPRK